MALDALNGQSVADLLKEYAESIEALKKALGEEERAEDDTMLLRFLIQELGNVEAATQRVKDGRQLRLKYATICDMALKGESLPQESKILEHLCYGRWQYPTAEAELMYPPMLITRSGKSNSKGLMQAVTTEEIVEYMLWERQRCFADATKKSQDTGKLVMMIGVNDMDGASMRQDNNFFKAVKEASETGACLFPLLTRKHVMVNSGFVVEALFRIASTFMPQRVLDKVAFMPCEQLLEASGIPAKDFPDFLGGECPIPGGSHLLR